MNEVKEKVQVTRAIPTTATADDRRNPSPGGTVEKQTTATATMDQVTTKQAALPTSSSSSCEKKAEEEKAPAEAEKELSCSTRDDDKVENPPPPENEGNDRVSLDSPPKEPLVPTSITTASSNSSSNRREDSSQPPKAAATTPPSSRTATKSTSAVTEAAQGSSHETKTAKVSATPTTRSTSVKVAETETIAASMPASSQPNLTTRDAAPAEPVAPKPPDVPKAKTTADVSILKATTSLTPAVLGTLKPPQSTAVVTTTRSATAAASAPSPATHAAAAMNDMEEFGPYVRPSDTSIADARQRLQTALQQTYKLRQAFTERVYGKYRVCLIPPKHPSVVQAQIATAGAAATFERLSQEINAVQQEKDAEKKQGGKLNNQVELLQQQQSSSTSTQSAFSSAIVAAASMWKQGTVDHADQLLFLSAGLNLIILPEEEGIPAEDLKGYTDRSPIHPVTGQRVRNMSQAAATAGDIMLERKRRALALRLERQQQQRLVVPGDIAAVAAVPVATATAVAATVSQAAAVPASTEVKLAPVVPTAIKATVKTAPSKVPSVATSIPEGGTQVPATLAPTPATKPSARALATNRSMSTTSLSAAVAGKAGRSRAPAGLSTATLLNLNPSAEELVRQPEVHKASAATMALIARGGVRANANSNKMTQQRLRHPHPESLGGRRRASMNPPRKEAGGGPSRTVAPMPPPPPPEPFLQSYLQLTLPPLPAAKERLERKALPVLSTAEASSKRARDSVQSVLRHFREDRHGTDLRKMTRIQLLQCLDQLDINQKEEQKPLGFASLVRDSSIAGTETAAALSGNNDSSTVQVSKPIGNQNAVPPLDPILTFSVLNAVGLIGRSPITDAKQEAFSLPSVNEENVALWSPKLMSLHKSVSTAKTPTFSSTFLSAANAKKEPVQDRKRDASSVVVKGEEPVAKRQKDEQLPEDNGQVPLETIRGGGEVPPDSDEGRKADESVAAAAARSSRKTSDASDKSKGGSRSRKGSDASLRSSRKGSDASARSRKGSDESDRSKSDPSTNPSAAVQPSQMYTGNHPGTSMMALHPQNSVVGGYHNTLSTMQLANHIQQLAGYDLATLGTLGGLTGTGMVGYSLPERAAAAHALFLGGARSFQQVAPAGYPNVGTHSAAVSGLAVPHARSVYGPDQLSKNASGAQQQAANHANQAKKSSAQEGESTEKEPASRKEPPKEDANTNKELSLAEKGGADNVENGTRVTKERRKKRDRSGSFLSGESAEQTVPTDESTKPDSSNRGEETPRDTEAAVSNEEDIPLDGPAREEVALKLGRERSDELGMKFFIPVTPVSITAAQASLIRSGHFYQAVQGIDDAARLTALLEYLHQAGAAVPIQKALVLAPLKERLNSPGFKTGSTGAHPISRDVVTAAILVWLWTNHEINFQKAFEKSGRIDVDPDCKWVIQAAVDIAVRELSHDIDKSAARGGAFAETAAARRGQHLKPGLAAQGGEPDREMASNQVEIRTASVVSRALMTTLHINPYIDQAIPQFEPLVAYLDESRLGALRAKSQERVLLATLLSRKATLSESFSHAYVSAMVRAGEALGHGKLFEIVQNEEILASTMIPYDIFTDDSGAWEDPCQGNDVFPSGLTGDDLMRRAHARAMIQKSLRKLQDRHSIRGGITNYGPYPDHTDKDTSKGVQGRAVGAATPSGTPRPGLKRRYSAISEPPVPPGTGSAKATSRTVYEPNHVSVPLDWPAHHLENKPYGRHRRGHRARSLSFSLGARGSESNSAKKIKRSMSIPCQSADKVTPSESAEDTELPKSTLEIDWRDVAGIFGRVEISSNRRSSAAKKAAADSHHATVPIDPSGNIFAPFCRKIARELESESEAEEEDVSDAAVLAHHEVVLDEMKAKITAFLEARKKQQERRKNRYSK